MHGTVLIPIAFDASPRSAGLNGDKKTNTNTPRSTKTAGCAHGRQARRSPYARREHASHSHRRVVIRRSVQVPRECRAGCSRELVAAVARGAALNRPPASAATTKALIQRSGAHQALVPALAVFTRRLLATGRDVASTSRDAAATGCDGAATGRDVAASPSAPEQRFDRSPRLAQPTQSEAGAGKVRERGACHRLAQAVCRTRERLSCSRSSAVPQVPSE